MSQEKIIKFRIECTLAELLMRRKMVFQLNVVNLTLINALKHFNL